MVLTHRAFRHNTITQTPPIPPSFPPLAGYLQSLVIKVPWKNLYSEPVIIKIDGLHLLVTPNAAASYDAGAEEAASLSAKKDAIAKYEASQKAALKRESTTTTPTTPPVPTTPGFTEKLITQIVKNVQIDISRIHVRYEDVVTDPDLPMGAGITLNGLKVWAGLMTDWRRIVDRGTTEGRQGDGRMTDC